MFTSRTFSILYNALAIVMDLARTPLSYITETTLKADQKFNIMSDIVPTIIVFGTAMNAYVLLVRYDIVSCNQFVITMIMLHSRKTARFIVWWLKKRTISS